MKAYTAKKRMWKKIFRSTRQHVKAVGLKEKDVVGAIADYRRRKTV